MKYDFALKKCTLVAEGAGQATRRSAGQAFQLEPGTEAAEESARRQSNTACVFVGGGKQRWQEG